MTECLKYKTGSTGKEKDYITREGIFRHMWMNTELTDDHKKYIYDKYPTIWELQCFNTTVTIFLYKQIKQWNISVFENIPKLLYAAMKFPDIWILIINIFFMVIC